MEEKESQRAPAKAREKNDSALFLSKAACAVISYNDISVERLKILCRELLHRVETMVETARIEPISICTIP